jgi:DNA-binding NarL/FixJ family response regulator
MHKPNNSDQAATVKVAISDCANAVHLDCESTTESCPVALLRSTLDSAGFLLREYEHLDRLIAQQQKVVQSLTNLTPRQQEIMDLVLLGAPSKNIAADLHISRRTVENHRAAIMKKTGSKSLPAPGRVGFVAALSDAEALAV